MRKFLVSLLVLFSFVSVSASTNGSVNNISIENIDVKVQEKIGYNEELEISYSINPRDAKNLNLTWEVSGTKKGVSVEFVSSNSTNSSDGIVTIKINNTLDEEVKLVLKAKQNGKVLSSTTLLVETKEETNTRVISEVNDLINKLDEKITKDNYEDNLDMINEIDELLKNNSEIEDEIEDDLLEKYETVKTLVNDFDVNGNKTFVLIVSIILVIVFSVLIIWIFLKEDE